MDRIWVDPIRWLPYAQTLARCVEQNSVKSSEDSLLLVVLRTLWWCWILVLSKVVVLDDFAPRRSGFEFWYLWLLQLPEALRRIVLDQKRKVHFSPYIRIVILVRSISYSFSIIITVKAFVWGSYLLFALEVIMCGWH